MRAIEFVEDLVEELKELAEMSDEQLTEDGQRIYRALQYAHRVVPVNSVLGPWEKEILHQADEALQAQKHRLCLFLINATTEIRRLSKDDYNARYLYLMRGGNWAPPPLVPERPAADQTE